MLPFAAAERTTFPFHPGEYRIKHLSERWEQAACRNLRHEVFCHEQKLFDDDDADARDPQALTIAALACMIGSPEQVVGTVRIHCDDEAKGLWSGSRLAVHADFRRSAWLGSELIRHAVSTAHARGCRRFLAQVQVQNRALFTRLHWHAIEVTRVCGHPHVRMEADLAHYPPRAADEIAFYPALHVADGLAWRQAS